MTTQCVYICDVCGNKSVDSVIELQDSWLLINLLASKMCNTGVQDTSADVGHVCSTNCMKRFFDKWATVISEDAKSDRTEHVMVDCKVVNDE